MRRALLQVSPRRVVISVLLLLLCGGSAIAEVAIPPQRAAVTDLTQTLTPEQSATLERRLRDFETRKDVRIAVLLVPTTQPETIEQYSIRVTDAWKLRREGVDAGVLLLVARQDRTVRIEVGYGLEGALPDVIADRIIERVIVPRFRSGDFFGGLDEALTRIMAVVEGEPLRGSSEEGPPEEERTRGDSVGPSVPLLLMLLFVGSGILRRMLGSLGGASATAGLAGILVWILTSVLAISIGAAVIAFLFTLFSRGGGGGWASPRGGRWRGGGFGGWGGGGGGFGGGGWSSGGFGGGGASGRW